MRRCKDRSSDAVIAPEIGMEFDLLPKAYDFYNLYSWEIGTFRRGVILTKDNLAKRNWHGSKRCVFC
jgi:hypothetical protein